MLTYYRIDNGVIVDVIELYSEDDVNKYIQDNYVLLSNDQKLYHKVDGTYDFEENVNVAEETAAQEAIELVEAKTRKLEEINKWTEAQITGGFVSSATGAPVTYDSDVETQITMSRIRANCENERFTELYPTGAPCRGYAEGSTEKTVFMLTPEQIITWDEDLGIHIGNCKIAGWAKQAQLNAATTVEDVAAVDTTI